MRAIVDPEREVELGESCYYCVVRYGTVDCKASNRDAPTEEVITGTPTVATAPYFSSKVRRGPAWQLRMGRAMRLHLLLKEERARQEDERRIVRKKAIERMPVNACTACVPGG